MVSSLVAVTAKYRLHVFQRIRKYVNTRKVKVIANVFSNTQFYHASMIWMFAEKHWYQKFKRYIAEHCILYTRRSYEDLLLMNDNISIHQIIYISSQQICHIFKSVNNFSLQFMWNYFSFKSILYELRKWNVFFSSGIDLTRD